MVVFKNFVNIFFVPELRKKCFFTLIVLIVYRLGSYIPVIGIDINKLTEFIAQHGRWRDLLHFLGYLSGGGLEKCTIFALGISPYITASIVMQLLSLSIPTLEQYMKEGEYGRKVINQYTRYLALLQSVIQSILYIGVIEKYGLAVAPGWGFRCIFILSLTVGSMFVMWLGEQISLFGIGSGSSMIIFAGIVARFPSDFLKLVVFVKEGLVGPIKLAILIIALLAIIACIIFLEKSERQIPVQYTHRIVGQRMQAGQTSYIPFKINSIGIMPVIFANAALNIPVFILSFAASRFASLEWLSRELSPTGLLYNVLDFFLIIYFYFLYMALQFNPEQLAENLKKGGGFLLGIRPGRQTAEFFNYLLNRLGLVGSIYLGLLALLPSLLQFFLKLPSYLGIMSGTSLLIVVGVALDMAAQIETYLLENRYEGFLTVGRLRGRKGR